MRKSINAQTRRTKQWLTDALISLTHEKPYRDITIQELVSRADLSRTAFYNHYSSKDEILREKIIELYHEDVQFIETGGKNNQWENWIRHLEFYLLHRDFYAMIYRNGLSHMVYTVFVENYQLMADMVTRTTGEAVIDQELYVKWFVPYHRMAEVTMTLQWLAEGDESQLVEMATLFYSMGSLRSYNTFRELYNEIGQRRVTPAKP